MLRNAINDHWQKEQLPIGSYIHAGGQEFRYEANETSVIDPADVMQLYEDGDITKEQFLSMVTIRATEAKNVLGGDQVADFTKTVVGNKVDVRMISLPVEQHDDEFVMSAHKVRKKVKRRVFGTSKPKETTKSGRVKRKINTKVSK